MSDADKDWCINAAELEMGEDPTTGAPPQVRIAEQQAQIERLEARVAELEHALTLCERATWKEGQTDNGLVRDVRRIAKKAIKSDGSRVAAVVEAAKYAGACWDAISRARLKKALNALHGGDEC